MFNSGFEKVAKEKEDHTISRVLLGNPISAAVHARKGEKTKAFGHAFAHHGKNYLGGLGIGGALGAAAGGLKGGKEGAKRGAAIGAGLGGAVGSIKGNLGREAGKIHKEYQKD